MGFKSPNCTQVPNDLIDVYMRDLTEAQLQVLLCYFRHASIIEDNKRPITVEYILERTELSVATIEQSYIDLEEMGVTYRGIVAIDQSYDDLKSDGVGQQKKTKRAGYVYLVKELQGQHYKIGRTIDPEDRLRTFKVQLPFKVRYEALIKTDDMVGLERNLHLRFADLRVEGEWFELNGADVDWIKTL